jgi:hypothetical protein
MRNLVLAPDLQSDNVKGENDNCKPWHEMGYSTCGQNQKAGHLPYNLFTVSRIVIGPTHVHSPLA